MQGPSHSTPHTSNPASRRDAAASSSHAAAETRSLAMQNTAQCSLTRQVLTRGRSMSEKSARLPPPLKRAKISQLHASYIRTLCWVESLGGVPSTLTPELRTSSAPALRNLLTAFPRRRRDAATRHLTHFRVSHFPSGRSGTLRLPRKARLRTRGALSSSLSPRVPVQDTTSQSQRVSHSDPALCEPGRVGGQRVSRLQAPQFCMEHSSRFLQNFPADECEL